MSELPSDRALLLLKKTKIKDLAIPHSKEYARWQNIKRGKARISLDDAGELANFYPEYAMWLLTGEVLPEMGQTSPDLDEVRHSDSGIQSAG